MGDTYRRSVKIFIGGLSFETTDEALKRYFEQFGQVSDAIVMKDAVSRRSRGFGFITYMSSASVDEALSVKQHIVDNRRVEAKRAVPRSEVPTKVEPQLTQSPSLQPQTAWDAPFGMENYVLRGVGPEGRTRSNSTVSAGSMGGLMALDGVPMASKIFVGGLHYETRDASLQTYFEQFGPVQTAEVMFNRETHKSRGFGFVVFELEESANAVLQSTHHTVNGKVVEVKRAVPRAQSSTGGSNPSSPAMMGYPPSPSALGPGVCATALGKSASAAASKRPQRPRAPRDAMAASSNGAVAPGASPQRQRYPPPTTSYAAALRYGAGRQQTAGMPSHGGGKPPQHHGHMQGREDVGSFRLHSAHSNFLPPSATARAEAAAAHAFVQELKAWDVENPGQVLTFEESFDYYNEQQQQQQRGAPRDFAAHTAMGGGNGNFDASIPGAGGWQGPGPGSGLSPRAAWAQQAGQGGLSRQQQQSQRPPGDVSRVLAHNRMDNISPRHAGHFSTFPCHEDGGGVVGPDGGVDPHSHSYRSASGLNGLNLNGDDYHNGHGQNPLGEAQNGRLLSPGEAGGTPALMGSSPLLGDSGILETAFAELKLDGSRPLAMNPSLADGPVPNGDGPSLLNGIGGGGPPSASSEVLPYGRTGGETALDGGGGADGLAGSGVWRADAFGSALGVNVASTASEMGSGMRGVMSERKDIIGGGLGEHFMATLGGAEGATTQVNMGWH